MSGILSICYLIASVTFILGLKMLSNPATARKGNLIAAGGMIIAILGTIFLYENGGKKLGKLSMDFFSNSYWNYYRNTCRKESEDDSNAGTGELF